MGVSTLIVVGLTTLLLYATKATWVEVASCNYLDGEEMIRASLPRSIYKRQ